MNDRTILGVELLRRLSAVDRERFPVCSYIKISAKLHQLGEQEPRFSVTGEIKTDRGRWESGGCLHHEIARAAPELAPLIALHLSTEMGVPLHAEANGWYWLAGALGGLGEQYHGGNGKGQHWKDDGLTFDGYREATPDECLAVFADHCRVDMEEAQRIAQDVADHHPSGRKRWVELCEGMRPRWFAEAGAGMELLHKLGAK